MPENEKQLSEISTFTVGDYRVEPAALRVIGNDQTSRLEPRAMQLLVYFAIHAGRVISRTELEQQVWQGRVVGEDALTNSISKLRRILGDNARQPHIIETVPKTGYRLIAGVQWLDKQDAETPIDADSIAIESRRKKSTPGLWFVVIAMLAIAVAGWFFYSTRTPSIPTPATDSVDAGKPSIAIIPFENQGEKPQDYFANGITSNLITDMSKISGMTVIA
ncbi:MAG: winged helix-turn-helix domain-containing protein, partial [Arenicellales bacterium]